MNLDYNKIGKRIARCRNDHGLTQAQLSEMVGVSDTYISNIERAVSIPSTEVIMRLALALDTTPDTFLVGTARLSGEEAWRTVADQLRGLDRRQLDLVERFIGWVREQKL